MTLQTRNRLIVLFIFAFPFMVIIAFAAHEYFHPTPATPPPSMTDTNFIHSPR
ncbi:MAG TPA: hypothetical protein VGM58_06570 [Verrucomicrobiae bacterium]|jgi:hypothetical protein